MDLGVIVALLDVTAGVLAESSSSSIPNESLPLAAIFFFFLGCGDAVLYFDY